MTHTVLRQVIAYTYELCFRRQWAGIGGLGLQNVVTMVNDDYGLLHRYFGEWMVGESGTISVCVLIHVYIPPCIYTACLTGREGCACCR